jgi:hypothetical protein
MPGGTMVRVSCITVRSGVWLWPSWLRLWRPARGASPGRLRRRPSLLKAHMATPRVTPGRFQWTIWVPSAFMARLGRAAERHGQGGTPASCCRRSSAGRCSPHADAGPDAPVFRSRKGGAPLYPRAVISVISSAGAEMRTTRRWSRSRAGISSPPARSSCQQAASRAISDTRGESINPTVAELLQGPLADLSAYHLPAGATAQVAVYSKQFA